MIFRYRDWAKDMKVLLWVFVALALSVAHCSTAEACSRCGRFGRHCVYRPQVVQHVVQKVVAVPVYQKQYISYFVGQPLRVDAIVQKTIQSDPEYQAFQQYKAFVRQQHAQPQQPQQGGEAPADPQPGEPQQPGPYTSVLATKCASCHSGSTPKGQLLLDGTAPLSDEIRVSASRAVMEGRMPPKERPPLTDQEYSDVLREIITFKNE